MAEIINFNTTLSVRSLMSQIQLVRYNPSLIQTTILDYLQNVTEGKVDIVDPTNPFVFLLEASAVTTAASIIENENLLRLQYPSLAIDEEELYLHMSDKDILNRFARPSIANFDVVIMKSDLLSKMVDCPDEQCRKVIIPRNTQVKVSDMYFSIEYPIEIRQMYHGGIHILYDTSITSKIYTVGSALINYDVKKDGDLTEWLVFKLPMYQFKVESHQAAVTNSSYFEHEVAFSEQFYTVRIYYYEGDVEKELRVSLTDQVYDPKVPTAILKILGNRLIVNIPRVYIANDTISGNLRIDVYTTKGYIAVNLSNYKLSAFETNLMAFNKQRDLSDYTNAMSQVIALFSCSEYVNAGDPALSFTELKERLINNSLSGSKLPITNKQMEGTLLDSGFELITNTDVITNRIFVASRRMPLPSDNHLYVPLDASINSFYFNEEQIKLSSRVIVNSNSTVIRSNSLFKSENGVLKLLPDEELAIVSRLTSNELSIHVNQNEYYYVPFWYVLDNSSNEFKVRCYHLDEPKITGSSVIGLNSKTQTFVNTGSLRIIKRDFGYTLFVETLSDSAYKEIPLSDKKAYISVKGVGENDLLFITSKRSSETESSEVIFEFDITTSHWIDENSNILINNGYMYNTDFQQVLTGLSSEFNISYTRLTGKFEDTDTILQDYYPNFLTSIQETVLTVEKTVIGFGYDLEYLWRQTRSIYTDPEYKKYEIDIPLTYENDFYKRDPITGSALMIDDDCKVSFEVLHYKGDPVIDNEGNIVLKHRKGDPVLDTEGNPLVEGTAHIYRLVDMLLLDAKLYFSTDPKSVTYKNEIRTSLVGWIRSNLSDFNNRALEQTRIYFKPKNTLGYVRILNDAGSEVFVKSSQKLYVGVYVSESVYTNTALRENLTLTIIKTISDLLNNKTVSTGNIIKTIMDKIGSSVNSVSIKGLGGKDYNTITIIDNQDGLTLAKKLYLKSDGNLIILEDIEVDFINALPD